MWLPGGTRSGGSRRIKSTSGLLFGLPLAVTSFNRVSQFTEAVGRRLLYVLTSLYFDDAHITDWASSKGSAQASFSSLNDLLGTPFAEKKRQPMHPMGTNPGLDLDFSAMPESCGVKFWVRERLQSSRRHVGSRRGSWDVDPRGSLQTLQSFEFLGAGRLRQYRGRGVGRRQGPPAGTRHSHHRSIADLL